MTLQDRTSWTEPDGADAAVEEIRSTSHGLEHPDDLDRLVERFGDRTYVLLGAASHGTSEYYRWRSRLTARLVQEKDFSFVAVEGDWTDCYEVNRYVKGLAGSHETILDTLEAFDVATTTDGRRPRRGCRQEDPDRERDGGNPAASGASRSISRADIQVAHERGHVGDGICTCGYYRHVAGGGQRNTRSSSELPSLYVMHVSI